MSEIFPESNARVRLIIMRPDPHYRQLHSTNFSGYITCLETPCSPPPPAFLISGPWASR